MLTITVPAQEYFNEHTGEFISIQEKTLKLEHSLISLHKWESKYHKPFLSTEKTPEEIIEYIKCMTIDSNVPQEVYLGLTAENVNEIQDYIADPMTATTFTDTNKGGSRDIITAELIYYWMIANSIPWECEKWHINKLFTLIRVCADKANPKKMSKADIMRRNSIENARRKALHHSHG